MKEGGTTSQRRKGIQQTEMAFAAAVRKRACTRLWCSLSAGQWRKVDSAFGYREGVEEKEGGFFTTLGRWDRGVTQVLKTCLIIYSNIFTQCLFLPCPVSTFECQSPRFQIHPRGQGGGGH